MSFSIDGITWDYPCTIERVAEVTSSDVSGMMLNKTYFNDVLGTWMKYTIAIAIPTGKEGDYTAIYEALTDPVSEHTFVLPYNYQDGFTIRGRVQVVSDAYVRLPRGQHTWRKTKFEIIANHPTKEASLGDVGYSKFPDMGGVGIGDIYEYTAEGWRPSQYVDGDDVYY